MNFKFGVIYAKKGQTTDDEMFGNSKFQSSCKLVCILLCMESDIRLFIFFSSLLFIQPTGAMIS